MKCSISKTRKTSIGYACLDNLSLVNCNSNSITIFIIKRIYSMGFHFIDSILSSVNSIIVLLTPKARQTKSV